MTEEKVVNVETFGNKPNEEVVVEETPVEEDITNEAPVEETASIEEVPRKIPEKIKKEDFEKINGLSKHAENISLTIGSIEIQKNQMIMQATALRNKIESAARESLLNAGIDESDLENYKVAIEDGKIVLSSQISASNKERYGRNVS